MLRAREGDDAAFALLVEAYQDRLVGILNHLVGDREAAEDLAQDVFLRIHRARDRYEPTAKFSTWLFRIANNLASNARRNRGRRRERQLPVQESGPMGARPAEKLLAEKSALMPSRLMARHEIRDVVRAALESLGERQQMAVLLHKFEGMSYADIGATMDLSPSAVKSLLSRAREKLKEQLANYVQE